MKLGASLTFSCVCLILGVKRNPYSDLAGGSFATVIERSGGSLTADEDDSVVVRRPMLTEKDENEDALLLYSNLKMCS